MNIHKITVITVTYALREKKNVTAYANMKKKAKIDWDFSLVYKFYWHMSKSIYTVSRTQIKKDISKLNYILSRISVLI